MTSLTFFFNFIPLLAIILLGVNLVFAPHNPYQEKNSVFECGFHSFLGQNRTQFSISFFIFGLLFLLFDLEILLVYPYAVTSYINDIYGLIVMLAFFLLLTLGFTFELGKNALKIDSRQMFNVVKKELSFVNKKADYSNVILSAIAKLAYTFKIYGGSFTLLKTVAYYIVKILMWLVLLLTITLSILCITSVSILYLDVIDLSHYYTVLGPSYMDQDPANAFPEYKQINSLEEMSTIKQQLLSIQQTLHDRLMFRKPQMYIDQINGLREMFAQHDYVKYYVEGQAARDQEYIDRAQRSLDRIIPEVEGYKRDLAECNGRIYAATKRIEQLNNIANTSAAAGSDTNMADNDTSMTS